MKIFSWNELFKNEIEYRKEASKRKKNRCVIYSKQAKLNKRKVHEENINKKKTHAKENHL